MTAKAIHKRVINKPGDYWSHGNETTKIAKAKNKKEARQLIKEVSEDDS